MSLLFGTKELYLLGLDLAIDQKTGSTHSQDHSFNEEYDISDIDRIKETMTLRDNFISVQGNFEKIVYTNAVFKFSIDALAQLTPQIKQKYQNIYNLSNGAYLPLTTAKEIEKINVSSYGILDKKKILQGVKNSLEKHAVTSLNKEDISSLKHRLKYSQEIGDRINKYRQSVSETNVDVFLANLISLVRDIIKLKNRETINIVSVYYSYFRYVLPIVFDLFNTQGLKNKKKHIKILNAMIEKELINIEEVYSKTLSDFIS